MINDELMLDEALRRNEINQQCQQPHDEISPPEQFQTKSGEGTSSPGKKPFSRSVSIGGGNGGKFKTGTAVPDNHPSSSPRKRNSSYETYDELDPADSNPGDFLSNPSPALQGGNPVEKFQLEKSLDFWLEL